MSLYYTQVIDGWVIRPSGVYREMIKDERQHSVWEAYADECIAYTQDASLFIFVKPGIPSGRIPLTVIDRLKELESSSPKMRKLMDGR